MNSRSLSAAGSCRAKRIESSAGATGSDTDRDRNCASDGGHRTRVAIAATVQRVQLLGRERDAGLRFDYAQA
ncbi:hypothetical protein OV203_29845 [Nannocystis sp. ILAH1]|uniref:hypothetical protein n=1 Tax=unclassified Nannocystis TaxID=2627009 RepID=UPI00226E0F48|nr:MULTISPECIES: hypothetical protein [unclassified Nannocystis]MCY0991387.1 hypothetical protein [Nannocystis sp. ILAH1]MCY1066436.1 hypothetical protein [Nannocystis sp. RBIL2]